MDAPRYNPRPSKLSPPEIAQLQQLIQQPQWQVVVRLNDIILTEMRRNYTDQGLLPAAEEAVAGAALKGGVQALKDFFGRIYKESNRDIHGNPRD